MGRLFGTDGVRGRANADLTPELALAVAVAAAHTLAETDRSHPPLAVVGRDPRASGEMLEAAVVAGLTSAGANVVRVGVLPTPGGGVPHRRGQGRPRGRCSPPRTTRCPTTASSCSPPVGTSCPTRSRCRSRRPVEANATSAWDRPVGAGVGPGARPARRRRPLCPASGRHRCRTGSTGSRSWSTAPTALPSDVAPVAYREAGAEVIAIHAEPDGLNINDGCGSQPPRGAAGRRGGARRPPGHRPRRRRRPVRGGDRRRRRVVDGDQVMAILALGMREAGS